MTLDRSAVLLGTSLSVSPLPDTMVASPWSQISLLGVPVSEISGVSVTGSRSGGHAGRLIGYSQGDGASFVAEHAFTAGEDVSVRGALHLGSGVRSFAFGFTVADENPVAPAPPAAATASASPGDVQQFHSRPDLRPPAVRVTTPAASGVAPGDIFVTKYATSTPGGLMIFDNSGQLVWSKALASRLSATDLQVQRYLGQPVLTWWQGVVLSQGFGEGEEIIDNAASQQIAVVHAGNGLFADLHDFQLTAQNTGLLTAFNPVRCDLSSVGGSRNGAATDGVYQEIDLKTGLVRREWHALDYVALSDSYQLAKYSSTSYPFDFFHINALAPRPDGRVMISARSTWAIYVLDERTGQVLSRVGGKRSTVKMGPGTATAWQHDSRALSSGETTVFDNGAVPKVHPYSRAVIERLNPATNTMTLVSQYAHASPPLSAGTQGNFQTLPNGDALIGWGSQPYVSEYSPSGRLLFDARVPAAAQSYRAFRFPWTGQPASPPSLALAAGTTRGSRVAYASWNGATQIASWRVLAGPSALQLAPAATVPRSGFETTIPLSSAGPWFQLQALDGSGTVLGSSTPTQAH
jgi:hypothetical protein